jgi:hypothetical protein
MRKIVQLLDGRRYLRYRSPIIRHRCLELARFACELSENREGSVNLPRSRHCDRPTPGT